MAETLSRRSVDRNNRGWHLCSCFCSKFVKIMFLSVKHTHTQNTHTHTHTHTHTKDSFFFPNNSITSWLHTHTHTHTHTQFTSEVMHRMRC